jgi:hypothetical protein
MNIEIFGRLARCNARFNPGIYIGVPPTGALAVLKIRIYSSDFLYFFGTFILELYIEFLSALVMFIKFNANAQVHPRLETFQKASS